MSCTDMNGFWQDPSKPIESCSKGRVACMIMANDESEWDSKVCQWNEMRFVW